MKLNSTYVEGLIPYINEKNQKNTFLFSSNNYMQRVELVVQNQICKIYQQDMHLGKELRKVFKTSGGLYITLMLTIHK